MSTLGFQGQISGCYAVHYEILNIPDGLLQAPNCCPSFKPLLLARSQFVNKSFREGKLLIAHEWPSCKLSGMVKAMRHLQEPPGCQ